MSEMAKALPSSLHKAEIEKLDCESCFMVDSTLVPHCDCPRHGDNMWYTRRIRLTND